MNRMDKVYIVCNKIFFEGNLVNAHIIKVCTEEDIAKEEIQKQANYCMLGDSKWRKSDTNGVNFIELKQGLYKRQYYIIQKYLDDSN